MDYVRLFVQGRKIFRKKSPHKKIQNYLIKITKEEIQNLNNEQL